METVQKIAFTNGKTSGKLLLIVEPWAEEYWIAAGATIEVVGRSAVRGNFEIEYSDECIVIYGWEASVVSVLENGIL